MKKAVCILLIACLLVGVVGVFAGCNKDYSNVKVLFLGDSIAEAVAGPSPIEQRANYGYYGILGQINGYTYNNRSISGHQVHELLAYISRVDDPDPDVPYYLKQDAYATDTLIGEADVICISITGNDLLWYNFPLMLYELVARETYGDDYVNQPLVKDCYEYKRYQVVEEDGTARLITAEDDLADPNSPVRALEPGDGIRTLERCVARVTKNIDLVLAKLRQKNPNATIIFQNVYNPVDDESEMIPVDLVQDLMKINPKYDFSTAEGVAEYRRWGAYLLGRMSDVLEAAAKKNKKVEFVNMSAAFDKIYRNDQERGKTLIFEDGVHPSDQGHAAIAATLQDKLVKLGFANKKQGLANYKTLRKRQLEQMYKDIAGFDYDAACQAIDKAKDMLSVGNAYFDAIKGYTPILSADPAEGKVTNGKAVAATERYDLSRIITRKGNQEAFDFYLQVAQGIVTSKQLTLNTDGTMEVEIKVPVDDLLSLLPMLGGLDIDGKVIGGLEDTFYQDANGNLTNLKMSGAKDAYSTIQVYADALVPGVGFKDGNFGRNFKMLYESMGIGIEGLESFTDVPYVDNVGLPVHMAPEGTVDASTVGATYNSYLDYLVAYMGRYQEVVDADNRTLHVSKLPQGISDKVTALTGDITLRIKTCYSLKTVKLADGTEYEAVYCGAYNEKTSPWMVLTKYVDEIEDAGGNVKRKDTIHMNIEVLGFVIQFQKVE